jgi:hypothetical protein
MGVLKHTRSIHFTFKLQTEDNVLSLIYRDILNDNFFSLMFMGIEKTVGYMEKRKLEVGLEPQNVLNWVIPDWLILPVTLENYSRQ